VVVFAEVNQDAVADLLNRTKPNGGGDSFYNLEAGDQPATRVWAKVSGGSLSGSATSAGPRLGSNNGGFDAGVDVASDVNTRIGVAIGYGDDTLSEGDGTHGSEQLFRIAGYASRTFGPYGVSVVLNYSHGWDHSGRETGIGRADGSFGVDDVTGAIQLARPFDYQGFKVTPDVGVQVSAVRSSGFAEQLPGSSAFALNVASVSNTDVEPYAEIGVSKFYRLSNGAELIPDVQVGYRYDGAAHADGPTLTAADGTTFSGGHLAYDRSQALVRLGLTVQKGGWTGFVRYKGDFAGNWTNQTGQVGIRFAF